MSRWTAEDGAEGEEPDVAGDLPDEQDEGDDDDATDDLPSTSMGEEEYEAFVARELTSEGRERGDPPVAAILIGLTLLIVLLAVLLA